MFTSLSKKHSVNLPRALFGADRNRLMKANLNTAMKLASIGIDSLFTNEPILLDVLVCLFFPCKGKRYIVDFPTPLSKELEWLGYSFLGKPAAIQEKLINQNAVAVLTPNELMGDYCRNLGARDVIELPNYPNLAFKPDADATQFRKQVGIPLNSKVALFNVAQRLKEVYGFDLLLESWRMLEKSVDDVFLIIVGPRHDSEMSQEDIISYVHNFGVNNVKVTGWIENAKLPDWVNSADVCLAPRTPGFPKQWYNDKDSTKISEYAALEKPIVATGYSYSPQYLLTDQTPYAFSEGIMKAFDGRVKTPKPHFWEDNEEKLMHTIERVL